MEKIYSEGELIRQRREKLGLTQQQVADAVSINIRSYQKFESGERRISSTSFRIGVAIADVLEHDVNELVNTPSVDEYLKNKVAFERLQAETEQEEL